jgi:Ribosomal protein L11 methyltransferase (PrmA)
MKDGYYYSLTGAQCAYLRGAVRGKVIADLGCGTGALALSLANMGATLVHAVDKQPARIKHEGVIFHQSYFDRWSMPKDVQVVVVSWPQNNGLPGIADLLKRVPEVIYLGKNTDGTSCGNGTLFAHLILRNTVTCIPDRRNTLIHYVAGSRPDRTLHHEEMAAITQYSTPQPYGYNPSPDRREMLDWAVSPLTVGACL